MNKVKKIIIPILIIAMFFCIIPKTENAAENKLKIGDINGDGIIDSRDTLRILEHIAASTISQIKQNHPEWILKNEKFKAGDINGDGVIDSIDTLRELEYIAASTVPKIAKNNPNWKKYIESKWTIEATGITLNSTNITIEKGKTSKLVATVKPTNASNKIVTWSSSDKKVATVDGIGNVTGKANGVTIITAKLSNGLAKTCRVAVKENTQTPVSTNPTTPTKQEPTTPTTTKQEPTTPTTKQETTKQKTTTSTPAKPTTSAKPTNSTTTNTPAKTTTLKEKTKSIAKVSTVLSATKLTYNGKVQTPAVTLKDGKTTLTKGKDYLVSYANNKNVGTATVIITGKGKYTGKVTKTFKINKATYNTKNLKFANVTVIYDGNKHSIKATGVPAGVKVTYTGNEKTSVGTYKITAKFVGDSKNYNTIKERKATLKIKEKSISKTTIAGIENKSYTRKAITQNIIIKDGNRILKNGTDYTVKYENNIKIGNNAKVVITGKGNYIGTFTKTFSINAVKATKLVASAPMWRQIEKGKFGQLTAKVSPDNATNKIVTWASSNTKAVKVNKSGTIHVVGHGTAKITATHKESGLSVTYTIVGYTPAKSISLNKTSMTINLGRTEKITVRFNPTTTSSKEITWTSSNPNIVSVNSSKTTNGSVTISAKAKGTAIITATSKYGPKATCKVTVTDKFYPEYEKIPGKSITKGQYANFRNVCTGNIAPGVLYRCINPILPYSSKEEERAYYADRLLEAHGVNTVLNLSDTIERMKRKGYSKATYYKKLLNSRNVHSYIFIDDGKFGTTEKKKVIVNVLRGIIKNDGPYVIHCKWGQGRTGFVVMLVECLMDGQYEYMYNDFKVSFSNLDHSGANKEFSNYMKTITGKSPSDINNPKASDWKNINFVKCAENYLKAGGMSDNEITTLKNRLAGK